MDESNRDTGDQDLVDCVEAMGDGLIATKCALHGAIYLWSLPDTLKSNTLIVKPLHVLRWSNTDNYFMFIGAHKGMKHFIDYFHFSSSSSSSVEY